ncbi:hypothetical protein B1A52_03395 [Corynebacterium diphtheriae]|nr:hypothetical protein B1A52_03395 [Corynebacterium diphtheriae]
MYQNCAQWNCCDGAAQVQAGSGVVRDSIPQSGADETLHKAHVALLDNHDSFVYNLVDAFYRRRLPLYKPYTIASQ